MSGSPGCTFCGQPLTREFVNLGMSPLANAYVSPDRAGETEPVFPLVVYVCERCYLVQLPAVQLPEAMFGDYAYFSSFSDTWLDHVRRYCDTMRAQLALDSRSQVIEIASNDGYLLQFFAKAGVPVLGIEPARNIAAVAESRGIETWTRFFGVEAAGEIAGRGRQADLLIANNVLAHVPAITDFVAGLAGAVKPTGLVTIEFPHLLRLMEGNQFDTIYHEHHSYLSLGSVRRIFAAHGLDVVDVEQLPTHGGSLRVHARRTDAGPHVVGARVAAVLAEEQAAGLESVDAYARFSAQVADTKRGFLQFLHDARARGKRVAAYGAPAKGNTLLNYCGIGPDLIEFTVDRNPGKQGLLLPGSRIPIFAPDRLREARPDYVVILPWNIKDEVVTQMADVRAAGTDFVVPIPRVEIVS